MLKEFLFLDCHSRDARAALAPPSQVCNWLRSYFLPPYLTLASLMSSRLAVPIL